VSADVKAHTEHMFTRKVVGAGRAGHKVAYRT
jgi:hypothetical protein